MSLQAAIDQRGISEILHFSTNCGLVGALHGKHLLSRPLLKETDYLRHVLQLNSPVRPEEQDLFDKSENWVQFVNLSISEINRRFFDVSRNKWHKDKDIWWCILAFTSDIMTHDGVWFATTNNGYDQCCRKQGEKGFEALFKPDIKRKSVGIGGKLWSVSRGSRAINLPTCEQAEVLYPEKLSLDYLTTIYVEENDHHDSVMGWLKEPGFNNNIKVTVQPGKFEGKPN